MAGSPPRLTPTIALAAVWLAVYLLYLAVRPEPPVTTTRREVSSTTTTMAKNSRSATRPPTIQLKP